MTVTATTAAPALKPLQPSAGKVPAPAGAAPKTGGIQPAIQADRAAVAGGGKASTLQLPQDGRQAMDAAQQAVNAADAQGGVALPGGLTATPKLDDQGNVTGHELKGPDGQALATSARVKNEDGGTTEWARGADGSVLATADFDADGRLQGATVRTPKNEKGEFSEQRFDEHGLVGQSTRTATENGFRDVHTDAQGNVTAVIDRDQDGKIVQPKPFGTDELLVA